MKITILLLTILLSTNIFATISDCNSKIKYFAEDIAVKRLEFSPAGQYTNIVPDKKNYSKVTLNSRNGDIRELMIKLRPGTCEIVGVETLDAEFY